MTVNIILGIDGGGTKTVGRIEDLSTGESFTQQVGSSSLTNDFEGACLTLIQLIQELMAQANCQAENMCVVMGLAGAGNQSQVERLKRRLTLPFASLEIYNDARTCLYGANEGQAVAMVALGTGSVGARLDSNNSEHYVGGWGFPIGDDGGGAKLGFNAVQVLLDELDEYNAPESELGKHLMSSLGADKDSLLNWLRTAKPVNYAALARSVVDLAEHCNKAKQVMQSHAKKVERLISLTRNGSQLPVILMGGLAQATLPYLASDVQSLCQVKLGASIEGACWLAKQQISQGLSHSKQNKTNLSEDSLLNQLDSMISEERNDATMEIDLMDSKQVLALMNNEDQNVPLAVRHCLEPIADAVDAVVESFKSNGRLIYIGAGTSGRLGVLDAVECPPTFSVSHEQVVGIIAGGQQAIYKSVEGAEDDINLAASDLKQINFNANDFLVGIAASGRTPYVIGALQYAKQVGARTASVSCNPGSLIAQHADIKICPIVGPEVLTGSTRLKSGTAQKLVLNMISTAAMIRSGKSYKNLMVDVNASNKKLYARATRIVMQATHCDQETAESALKNNDYKAKPAILQILTGVSHSQAIKLLKQHNGFLRQAVESVTA